ncbi:MAG: hypothetical protein OXK74_08490 [Gemmatimonadota bacterium]|nr:hypothetical protein [Gemmatimonadota bacterium]
MKHLVSQALDQLSGASINPENGHLVTYRTVHPLPTGIYPSPPGAIVPVDDGFQTAIVEAFLPLIAVTELFFDPLV